MFEKIHLTFSCLLLLLILIIETSQFCIRSGAMECEIKLRKIDLVNDAPAVIRLLPGVGPAKLNEILELRKTEKNPEKILEQCGLKKKIKDLENYLDKE